MFALLISVNINFSNELFLNNTCHLILTLNFQNFQSYIYFSPNSLTDTSTMIMPGAKGDTSILKPSVMTAVPVILDKIYKGINANIQKSGPFSAKLIDFCVRYRGDWVRRGYDTPIMNKFIFTCCLSLTNTIF